MAKNKNAGDESTDLATTTESGMSTPGSFMPADFTDLIGDGFASIDTVMLGDPSDDKLPFYVGELIGPGEPVKMRDSENEMPTWAFHPATKVDGRIGFAMNVTHIVPASYMVHAACARIQKQCERDNAKAIVGIAFVEQAKTAGGRALNKFRIFEKYTRKTT